MTTRNMSIFARNITPGIILIVSMIGLIISIGTVFHAMLNQDGLTLVNWILSHIVFIDVIIEIPGGILLVGTMSFGGITVSIRKRNS